MVKPYTLSEDGVIVDSQFNRSVIQSTLWLTDSQTRVEEISCTKIKVNYVPTENFPKYFRDLCKVYIRIPRRSI